MLRVHQFTFNAYQENTYIISDEDGEAAIIDPGCYSSFEQRALDNHIADHNLNVRLLLNTHGHIDHMLGNGHVKRTYQVPFVTHKIVEQELALAPTWGQTMGLSVDPSPKPDRYVDEGDIIELGREKLSILFVPGHSPGHIAFSHEASNQLFAGDVLFQGSIGRTDLPGGDMATLMKSIEEKLLPLKDDVVVYPGHGPETTIGAERSHNPFIQQYIFNK